MLTVNVFVKEDGNYDITSITSKENTIKINELIPYIKQECIINYESYTGETLEEKCILSGIKHFYKDKYEIYFDDKKKKGKKKK